MKECGVKIENEHWYDHVPKSVIKVMKVRLPCYKTNRRELTELFITINWTS